MSQGRLSGSRQGRRPARRPRAGSWRRGRCRPRPQPAPNAPARCAGSTRGRSRQPSQHPRCGTDVASHGEHQDPVDAGAVQQGRRAIHAGEDGDLRECLGRPRRVCEDRRLDDIGGCRPPGRGVDQVMGDRAGALPAVHARARGRETPPAARPLRAQADDAQLAALLARVGDADLELVPDRDPGGEVAVAVDQGRPTRSDGERTVGEPALGNAVEVEQDAGRASDGGAPGCPRSSDQRRLAASGRETGCPASAAIRASSIATSTIPSERASAVRAQSSSAVIDGPTATRWSADAFSRDSSEAPLNRVKRPAQAATRSRTRSAAAPQPGRVAPPRRGRAPRPPRPPMRRPRDAATGQGRHDGGHGSARLPGDGPHDDPRGRAAAGSRPGRSAARSGRAGGSRPS